MNSSNPGKYGDIYSFFSLISRNWNCTTTFLKKKIICIINLPLEHSADNVDIDYQQHFNAFCSNAGLHDIPYCDDEYFFSYTQANKNNKWILTLDTNLCLLKMTDLFTNACKYDQLDIAQWLFSTYPKQINIHANNDCAFIASGFNQNLVMMDWLFNLDPINFQQNTKNLVFSLIKTGYIEYISWIKKNLKPSKSTLMLVYQVAHNDQLDEMKEEIKKTYPNITFSI